MKEVVSQEQYDNIDSTKELTKGITKKERIGHSIGKEGFNERGNGRFNEGFKEEIDNRYRDIEIGAEQEEETEEEEEGFNEQINDVFERIDGVVEWINESV